jgi:tetratricopeptide (TPR) repeat protein
MLLGTLVSATLSGETITPVKEEPGLADGRSETDNNLPTIQSLIRELGNEDFGKRESAAVQLLRRWAEAGPELIKNENSDEPEVRVRVRRILGVFTYGHWMYCACFAAGRGDFKLEREMLLRAAPLVDRENMPGLLNRMAFCHRGLRENTKALAYMELKAALLPQDTSTLYCLAIMQKNANQTQTSLETIKRALELEPTDWGLLMLKAGYLYQSGKKDEGRALFASTKPSPEMEATSFCQDMLAWSYAVMEQREKFFAQFERVLSTADDVHTFMWISQDADLDPYRNDPRFKPLVDKHRDRVFGELVKRLRENSDPNADRSVSSPDHQ